MNKMLILIILLILLKNHASPTNIHVLSASLLELRIEIGF